jgi:hypothetical protein
MSPEQIEELLEAAKPAVIESLKKELSYAVTHEAKAVAVEHIKEHTIAWVKEHIIPECTKALIENKDGMIAIATTLGPAIVDEVVKGMTLALSEKLKSSWERKKIFGSMFD